MITILIIVIVAIRNFKNKITITISMPSFSFSSESSAVHYVHSQCHALKRALASLLSLGLRFAEQVRLSGGALLLAQIVAWLCKTLEIFFAWGSYNLSQQMLATGSYARHMLRALQKRLPALGRDQGACPSQSGPHGLQQLSNGPLHFLMEP